MDSETEGKKRWWKPSIPETEKEDQIKDRNKSTKGTDEQDPVKDIFPPEFYLEPVNLTISNDNGTFDYRYEADGSIIAWGCAREIGPIAFTVYHAILADVSIHDGIYSCSNKIAETLGLNEKKVQIALNKLMKYNLVRVR
jgi:hypothetical protein